MKFLDEIKKDIRPDDLTLREVDEFIKKINSLLRKSKVIATCTRGGSTAKGTFLKDDHDVDLFVIFDYSYRNKDISSLLLNALKSLKPDVIHGSRDYLHINRDKMAYEIVPTLLVKDPNDIENVTDMSPHHVLWVNKRLDDNSRDDIRLAKKFCKAQRIYGAESYIQGFSGHVLDILIINYGGFLKLLKAASRWQPKVVIDVEKHWADARKSIDKSKTYGPLIIVDPVQPQRNAAAAISEEKFRIFINASKEFLKKPSKDFFIVTEFELKEIKKNVKGKTLVSLEITASEGKTDVVGAKLLGIFEAVKKQLAIFGFTVTESDWKWDKRKKSEMYFIVKEKQLPKTFERCGPPLSEKKACAAFIEKNKKAFLKKGRLYADIERKIRTPKEFVKSIIKEDFIKSKAEKITLT